MSMSVYHPPDQKWEPPRDKLEYLGLNAHDAEVLRSRAIPPDVAEECGFHTADGALRIPHYDIAGDVWAVQRRPHHRRPGAPKYLFDAGTRMGLHVPLPSRRALADITKAVILTESALKAAAIIAALRREGRDDQYAVVSIAGVTTWKYAGGPIPDLGDFPSRTKTRDTITHRRPLIIAHDSNALTNANVIRARWEITDYLRRVRKFDVRWLDVPEGPGETPKARERGIDDALAAGHTMEDMLQSAYPAPDIMPAIPGVASPTARAPEGERVAWLEARVAHLEQHVSLLTEMVVSPHYTPSEKTLLIRSAGCALAQGTHTTRPDAEIEVDHGKVTNDFRPTKKDHPDYQRLQRSPVNADGTFWYLRRSSVSGTAQGLARKMGDRSPIRTEMEYTRAPGDPTPHRETKIIMKPPANMVEFLQRVALWRPDAPQDRPYTTQAPCSECGEIHEQTVTRLTICGTEADPGCGAIIDKKTTTIPVPPASRPTGDLTDNQREHLDAATARPVNTKNLFTGRDERLPSSGPPGTRYSENIFLRDRAPVPAGLWSDSPVDTCTTLGCRNPISPHRTYICDECAAVLEVAS